MNSFYDKNGLMFWDERQIILRNSFRDYFSFSMRKALLLINPMWQVHQIEAPLLTPRSLVNKNYTEEDMFVTAEDLVLRPETTPGSFLWLRKMFDDTQSGIKTPVCVWQAGKSFRREQDQPTKHMRLKEFYQQEFQCVFASDTANDYHQALLPYVQKMIHDKINLPIRQVDSERLPDYSKKTIDIEVDNGDKWMELCSISLRTDFPGTIKFNTKGKLFEKDLLVVEVAIGLDRCVYNFIQSTEDSF